MFFYLRLRENGNIRKHFGREYISIGKHYFSAEKGGYVKLIGVTYSQDNADSYSIYTENNLNAIANALLSVPDDVGHCVNFYKFNEDLTVDQAQLQADIAKYGIFEYYENDFFTKEEYDFMNLRYINIILGKGLISYKEFYASHEAYNSYM